MSKQADHHTRADLTTVAEDEAVEGEDDEDVDAQQDEEDGDDDQAASRGSRFSEGGRASLISGTTAKTSFSAQQISEMDPDLIVDSLKGLDNASEELLKLLVPDDKAARPMTWKDIVTRGTRNSKLYMKRVETLRLYKSDYIAPPSEYIQPSHVVRALANVTEGDVPRNLPRPDSVLRKANLTTMLQSLLIAARDPLDLGHESFDALEAAEGHFATAVAADGLFRKEDFDMALALGTQLTIKRIASYVEDPNFDPQGTATGVFFDYDEDDVPTYRHLFTLGLDDLSGEDQANHLDQINFLVEQLKEPFEAGSGLDSVTALNSLRAKHPWDGLINHLMVYYENRKRTLDHQVRQVGGVDALVERLRAFVQADEEDKRLAQLRSSIGGTVQEKPADFGNLAALKALASNGIAQTTQGPAPVAPMVPEAGANDVTQIGDEDDNTDFRPQGSSDDIRALSEFQDAQRKIKASKGKGRSFNDPQPGASRVSWDDSQPSQQPTTATFQLPPSSVIDPALSTNQNGKRPREEEYPEIDPTQDDGGDFQTDTRDMSAANARRQSAPRATHRPIAPRREVNSNLVPYETPGSQQSQYGSPAKRQRKNPGASIPQALPPTQGPSSSRDDWRQAKVQSKIYRPMRENKPAHKQRVPWSIAEEDRLFDLIEQCEDNNVPYAILKKQDVEGENILEGRDKEQMRQKARNMKVLLLK